MISIVGALKASIKFICLFCRLQFVNFLCVNLALIVLYKRVEAQPEAGRLKSAEPTPPVGGTIGSDNQIFDAQAGHARPNGY